MPFPTYELEDEAKRQGYKYVVGIDESGRGSLAGPVVAAAVYIPEENITKLVDKANDSKKMTAKKREAVYDIIKECCSVGIGVIEADVIDDINILEATKLAMQAAVVQLENFDYLLIDGTVDLTKHITCPQRRVVKGDSLSISIAAASIIAKVTRDRIMLKLHEIFPIYNWDRNKAYGTKEHIDAIKIYGITDFHRVSFRRVGK